MKYANHRGDGNYLLIVSSIILNTTWKSQLLIDEQYNERTANCEQYY
jgi:galactokinase